MKNLNNILNLEEEISDEDLKYCDQK